MELGKDCIGVGCGAIILNDNNEVLLVKKSFNSREPGNWSRPGGKVKFGEYAEDAIKREVKEETGIDIDLIRFLEMTQIFDIENENHWIILGFVAKYSSGILRNREPLKNDEVKWFSLDALPDNLTSNTRNAIETYIKIK